LEVAIMRTVLDPRWTGIIEVLVHGLDGSVRWEPDSAVLQLPDRPRDDRVGDLDVLSLCLCLVDVSVFFDSCGLTPQGASSSGREFLRKLVESGLEVDVGTLAA
jgi:hypothetical protein